MATSDVIPERDPFSFSFKLNRITPRAVLVQRAGYPMVRMRTCWPELTETHFDHASNVNMRYAKCSDIESTYATALMGGEPFSEWN